MNPVVKVPIFVQQVLPFLFLYSFIICVTLAIDFLLHSVHLVFVGRYLGFIGTCMILFSFVFSLRKRKIIQSGSPKTLIQMHEWLTWAGSVLILVHAGIHFNAILPWLAIFMLLINVASGSVGVFLLKNASITLRTNREELLASGESIEETDKRQHFDTLTVDAMKKWKTIHMPIAVTLGFLSVLHIVTMLMFS